MKKISSIITTIFCVVTFCDLFAGPIADTPENRHYEAERYLRAVPLKKLFKDTVDKMAVNLPPDQRDQFKKFMTSQLDFGAITKAWIDAMVKHFTTEELKALADFYGSPVGKSAMKKIGALTADMIPAMEAETMKAEAKAEAKR
jgi:hypothetical protein